MFRFSAHFFFTNNRKHWLAINCKLVGITIRNSLSVVLQRQVCVQSSKQEEKSYGILGKFKLGFFVYL